MILTFNILNQVFGPTIPFYTFIQALNMIPYDEIQDDVPGGFVKRKYEDKHIKEVCNYLGQDYWQTIESVAAAMSSAHPAEVISHGRNISEIELPLYIKAKEELINHVLPSSWPESTKTVNSLPVQMTFGEWIDQSVTLDQFESGYYHFSYLKNSQFPDLSRLKPMIELKTSHAEFEIQFMRASEYLTIKNQFTSTV